MIKKFSIEKGYNQVQRQHLNEVKQRIMDILAIKSRTQWSLFLRGDLEPIISMANEIEAMFLEYGISDIYVEE